MIFFNLLLIAFLVWPMCREAGVIKVAHHATGHHYRAVDYPGALMVLTATGYFYTTLCASPGVGLKPFIW